MRRSPKPALLLGFLISSATANPETIERLDPALDALIAPGTRIETLCRGFDWSEGPLWDTKTQQLIFSDVPRNTIYQWREGNNEAEIWMKPSGFTGLANGNPEPGSNGLAYDSEGRLICCEHGDRRVSVLTKDGGKRTIADNFQGKRFNSPNDLAILSNGDIYFTDPPYGLPLREKDSRRELPFFGVFRIARSGEVTLLTDELERPNGIAFSPDEKTLYVSQSHAPSPVIMAYPVQPDGKLGQGRVHFNAGNLDGRGMPDGLKVDANGNLFATGPGGLLVISAEGKLLGRVLCGRPTSNVAFGEESRCLYLTSDDRILRIKLAD